MRKWDWDGERLGGVRVDDESLEARGGVEMAEEAEMFRKEMDKMTKTEAGAGVEKP